MKYYNIEKFDNLGFVKTAMVPKDIARWRIFSYDNRDDYKYYDDIASDFGTTKENIVRLLQVHSDRIKVVTKETAGEGVIRMEDSVGFDGLITNEVGIILSTLESDCTPVFIVDVKNRAIGMIHSGWRGTVKNITIKAIELMNKNYGTKKEDLLIHFGPAICGDCYIVDEDLILEFKNILNDMELSEVFKYDEKINKYHLDVTKSICFTLLKYGINESQITRTNICTYHDNIFASWRRDGDKTKQMLTCIMLSNSI